MGGACLSASDLALARGASHLSPTRDIARYAERVAQSRNATGRCSGVPHGNAVPLPNRRPSSAYGQIYRAQGL
jgi:hypothetical protein